jgi:hypothetical protein
LAAAPPSLKKKERERKKERKKEKLEGADASGRHSKALLLSRLIAGIVGSDLAECLDIRLFYLLCVV